MPVAIPVHVPYFQFDQQGVAFNMWYFGWFDDAMTEFLAEIGYPPQAMLAGGLDVQLVHTEADWRAGVRCGEPVTIDVSTERVGSTSFTLSFGVRVGRSSGRPAGRSMYSLAPTVPARSQCRPSSAQRSKLRTEPAASTTAITEPAGDQYGAGIWAISR